MRNILGNFKKNKYDNVTIYSPLDGQVIALADVEDETFSQGFMGDGIAIEPSNGQLKSPVAGVVKMLFPTKHAIGIQSEGGVELLIHIGIDTVELNGKYFRSYVKTNDKITVGQKLIDFDNESIYQAGYSCTTMVIVTNSAKYNIQTLAHGQIKNRDELMRTNEKL